ncbi:ubiquitin-specific protease [Thermoascus aurantiacus ATCC 26904]
MMNHHLPAVPHGQPPMPPPRRQHDMSYSTAPPNMRSPPAYMGYHPPHLNGHVPPAYAAQQYPHWYSSYPHMQPPPRPYQPPYAPLIVSSYPHSQPMMAPAHVPPPSFSLQPRTATSTPLQSTMSPPPPGPASGQVESQENPSANPSVNVLPSPVSEPAKSAPAFREPFRAPLPWLSVPDLPFPPRAPRRRRKPRAVKSSAMTVELPTKEPQRKDSLPSEQTESQEETKPAEVSAPAPSEPETPTTSHAASEADSTQPTTPSSAVPQSSGRTPAQPQSQAKPSRPAVPVVPIVPIVPGTSRSQAKDDTSRASVTPNPSPAAETGPEVPAEPAAASSGGASEEPAKPASPPRAAPKSWADLVRSKTLPRGAGAPAPSPAEGGGLAASRAESLVDVLNSLGTDVDQYSDKIAFIEPRGLVNTGNMCYMNSVLQILLYCIPFYQFLDHVGRRAAHSFKSDVPLIDAMIMFMREFRVIDAARSAEQLRLRLKANELEQYGEAFIPEYVYQVIRQLPRFRDMRRGHQQDAQEFLGFLLEELHEECTRAAKGAVPADSDVSTPTEVDGAAAVDGPADGWLEVGHKQKPAVTRSSGHIAYESPITRIFGGKIRSEFRVPGNKNSVTLEPYQPLQLDIGSPEVHNIIDALKGLTRPETIHGDFNSSRGPNVTATKQIFIETLPPVLILHLKRFQYDSVTQGTQKIWKKIGYPLELEIPREVFPPHRRNAMTIHGGLPRYRLIGVIYHHGKNASGGHYTVDVRRQDGREWIRLDDTVIRRIRSEDVAEAGSEEDPRVLAAALEQHKRDKGANVNIYDQFDPDDQDPADSERGWSQVNGGSSSYSKKAASNGVASPTASGISSGKRTPIGRYGSRDNKVAYLLFYQRITGS